MSDPGPKPKDTVSSKDYYAVEGSLFVISAPSGAGKTTLVRELIKSVPGLRLSVSYTTRKPRKGEADGYDYHFISEDEFVSMERRGEFLESANVHGNRYGTSLRDLKELLSSGVDVILDIDVQGARQLMEKKSGALPDAVYIFILPPSMEALKERLRGRDTDSEEQLKLRLQNAAGEIMQYGMYNYVIVNDRLEEALGRLKAVVLARRSGAGRINRARVEENFNFLIRNKKKKKEVD